MFGRLIFDGDLMVVPPLLSSIPPTEINLDDSYPSQRAVFTCHLERGSFEELSLTWLHSDNRPVQVTRKESSDRRAFVSSPLRPLTGSSSRLHVFKPIIISICISILCAANITAITLVKRRIERVQSQSWLNFLFDVNIRMDVLHFSNSSLISDKPIFLGPQTSDVFSVVHHRSEPSFFNDRCLSRHLSFSLTLIAILQCHFDSSPPARIEWTKRDRRANEYDEGQRIALDSDPQVIDVQSKQTGSTFVASELTVCDHSLCFSLDPCRRTNHI